jgi:hypothetical protein
VAEKEQFSELKIESYISYHEEPMIYHRLLIKGKKLERYIILTNH